MKWIAAVAAALSFAGCAQRSDYMLEPSTPPSHAPSEGRATVIFLRPSAFGLLAHFMIVDSNRQFLGESLAQSKFAVTLPPGEHWFVAYHDGDPIALSDAMHATLLPGRVYFVEVGPNLEGVRLLAITPRSESWSDVRQWLAETTELVPDVQAGQAHLDHTKAEVDGEISHGLDQLRDQSEQGLGDRTILPEDGISAE